jgi:hypothetical protein
MKETEKEINFRFDLRNCPTYPIAGNIYGLKLWTYKRFGTTISLPDINKVNLRCIIPENVNFDTGKAPTSEDILFNFNNEFNQLIVSGKGYKIENLSFTSPTTLPEKCIWLMLCDSNVSHGFLLRNSDDYKTYRLSDSSITDINNLITNYGFNCELLLQVLDCGISHIDTEFKINFFDI